MRNISEESREERLVEIKKNLSHALGRKIELLTNLFDEGRLSADEVAAILGLGKVEVERIFVGSHGEKRKLLVTGGAGFIGSNFVRYILRKYPNYEVINFDLLTYAGNLDNLRDQESNPRYKFIQGDLRDADLVDRVVGEEKPDIIVHFAAETHVDRSITGPDVFLQTNVTGTHNLLKAALGHGKIRFHHISTDEVFGSLGPDDPRFNEQAPYDPKSPYSASKAASDHLVRAYQNTYGLPVTISNCSNNYGPYHFPEKLFPLFITNLLEDKKVPLYGDGMNVRDWLYVEDHCSAVDLIIHQGKIGETYCIGGDAEKTNKEVTYKILEIMGKGEEMIEFVQDRAGHDRRYAIDATKIKTELGWRPQVSFEEGLRRTIDWFMENETWWRRVKSGEYKLPRREAQDSDWEGLKIINRILEIEE